MITLEKISKSYKMGDEIINALKSISLTISKNEYVALMGPSGSGKSTLMNILGCLDSPTSGKYILNDI
ncbi:MAG: ATP-binding cassette domain-containing protein, partial [Saprospiraceae bacterium]